MSDRTRRTLWAGILAIGAVAALGVAHQAWYGDDPPPAPQSPTASTRSTGASASSQATSKKLDILVVPGSVEAYEITDLHAKVTGYIQQLNVDIGDPIKAGQVLAVIDVPELHDELAQGQAEQAARQAGVEQAQANSEAVKKKLAVAQRQLAAQEATAKLRQETFDRISALAREQSASEQDLDDARAARDSSAADVEAAKATVDQAQAEVAVAAAAATLAQRQLDAAKAQVQRLETLVSYTKIIAPYDGLVSRRFVNRGALVQASPMRSDAILTVQRNDVMRVFVDVPEADAGQMTCDMAVTVMPYAMRSSTFGGSITRTARSIDPASRTLRVEIDLENPRGVLLHGMYVQVHFPLERPATQASTSARAGQ